VLSESAVAPDTLVLKLAFDTHALTITDIVVGEGSAGKQLMWRQTEMGLVALFYGGNGALEPGLLATMIVEASGDAESGSRSFVNNGSSAATSAAAFLNVSLAPATIVVSPLGAPHSADTDANRRIELAELLRVIQLFNAGAFACSDDSEDGFGLAGEDHDCAPHDLDYLSQNWRFELGELLRCIQFYNAPERAYHRDEAGEDGFAAGPE